MTLMSGIFLFDRPSSYDIKFPRENRNTLFGQATNRNCIVSICKCYLLVFNFRVNQSTEAMTVVARQNGMENHLNKVKSNLELTKGGVWKGVG